MKTSLLTTLSILFLVSSLANAGWRERPTVSTSDQAAFAAYLAKLEADPVVAKAVVNTDYIYNRYGHTSTSRDHTESRNALGSFILLLEDYAQLRENLTLCQAGGAHCEYEEAGGGSYDVDSRDTGSFMGMHWNYTISHTYFNASIGGGNMIPDLIKDSRKDANLLQSNFGDVAEVYQLDSTNADTAKIARAMLKSIEQASPGAEARSVYRRTDYGGLDPR